MRDWIDNEPPNPDDLLIAFFWVTLIFITLFLFFRPAMAFGAEYDSEFIADAIYIIEGGPKAKKPFGILSVPCEGYEDCRQVCINTINNSFTRWQAAGATGDFLTVLGNRYAPPQAHHLNKNWLPNLRAVLAKRSEQ